MMKKTFYKVATEKGPSFTFSKWPFIRFEKVRCYSNIFLVKRKKLFGNVAVLIILHFAKLGNSINEILGRDWKIDRCY